jgi:uncharacterized membrane protein
MTSASWWTIVAVVGGATVLMKSAGPLAVGGRRLPERAMGVIGLLGPAVLAALIVTQSVAGDHRFAFDSRLAGLAVAAVAIRLRAPVLVVLIAAAATTALVRLWS